MELNKVIEKAKKTPAEMKTGFKNQIAQLENLRKSLTSGMKQAKGRISGL